jgi:hypothetical protein
LKKILLYQETEHDQIPTGRYCLQVSEDGDYMNLVFDREELIEIRELIDAALVTH